MLGEAARRVGAGSQWRESAEVAELRQRLVDHLRDLLDRRPHPVHVPLDLSNGRDRSVNGDIDRLRPASTIAEGKAQPLQFWLRRVL